MTQLWEQNGILLTSADGSTLLECEDCPCEAVETIEVECCENPIPAVLTITILATGFWEGAVPAGCEEYEGLTFNLTYDPDFTYAGTGHTGWWVGGANPEGDNFRVALACVFNSFTETWSWEVAVSCNDFSSVEGVSLDVEECDPFMIEGNFGLGLMCSPSGCFYEKRLTITA